MKNDEREKQILQKLIKRFGTRWEAQAKKAMERLYEQIEAGTSITKAVATLRKEYGELFKLDGLQDMMTEAACYGYGIMPSVLTSTQHAEWGEALATAWDASGMTLSKKLHGTSVKMRNEIIRTLQTQMQRNQTWLSAARALYDGYSQGKNAFTGGKDIIRSQGIPKYIQKVLIATNDSQMAAAQRQALDNINRLARNGAPNKALQAAYNELLESAKKGSSQAMYKAARIAINEKCRYVAERIARTEMARAYADGFIAKISKDEDIAAVKFKLSGRHPTFDICDMYAKADMYNLGAGVYPKDKLPPLPVHPHCLCRYSEIIEGEVDMKKSADHVRAAGDTWLNGLSERQRRQVLGIDGLKAWKSGKDWRKYMRGYAGQKKVRSRLQNVAPKATQAVANDGIILSEIGDITVDTRKFTEYALNPAKAPDKAQAFKMALGYDLSNWQDLEKQILNGIKAPCGTEKGQTDFGVRYETILQITGANGKQANVLAAWIKDHNTGKVRLVSVYVKRRKKENEG